MAHREYLKPPQPRAIVDQRTNQKYRPADKSDGVQLQQRAPNDEPRHVRRGERGECCCRYEGEKDQRSQPDGERQKHKEAKEVHAEMVAVQGSSNRKARVYWGRSMSYKTRGFSP